MSDEENVQLDGWFTVGDSGKAYNGPYVRKLPNNFSADTDDIFMRSMIANYALEENAGGKPTGKFWMNKALTKAAAREVLATHKGLKGAKLDAYLKKYFDKAWGHFDVNRVG